MGKTRHIDKGNGKAAEFIILDRRRQVAKLVLEGMTQQEIADRIGSKQTTVSDDLKVIRKAWIASGILDYDDLKAEELEGLKHQEAELWAAWHRSCGVEIVHKKAVRREVKTTTNVDLKTKKVTTTDEGMQDVGEDETTTSRQLVGDPRFMAEILKVREMRCRLLGLLDDEQKNSNNVNINLIDWDSLGRPTVDYVEQKILELESKAKVEPIVVQPLENKGNEETAQGG